MGEQDFIRWGRISIQQTFEGTEKEFIFKGQVFVGEETFDICETSEVSPIEGIAGIILGILTDKGLLTGKEEISHRVCCEPETRTDIVEGTNTTVMINNGERTKRSSATAQRPGFIEGYLSALMFAFNRAVEDYAAQKRRKEVGVLE